MAEKITNQDKLDQMHELIIEIKKDSDFMMHELDDMHLTLNWIRRRERIRMFLSSFYWIFLIAISFGSYFYIKPILSILLSSFGGDTSILKSLESSVGGLPDLGNIKRLIEAGQASPPSSQ